MKYYFAGAESWHKQLKQAGVRNGLYSYFYINDDTTALLNSMDNVFIDSGAFSAWTRGERVDINEYIAWLRAQNKNIDVYALLDVIGNADASYANLVHMESEGLSPLPVFHMHESFDFLERYCKEYTYIALGGMAGKQDSMRYKRRFLDSCFAVMAKHLPIKVHGFGIASIDILMAYPFYSVDSTSWLGILKYGNIHKLNTIGIKYQVNIEENILEHHWLKQRSMPIDRCLRGISFMLQIEKFITNIWAKRGIVWDD